MEQRKDTKPTRRENPRLPSLSSFNLTVLGYIIREPGIHAAEISDRLGVVPARTGGSLQTLTSKGLVKQSAGRARPGVAGNHARPLNPTAAGKRVFERDLKNIFG